MTRREQYDLFLPFFEAEEKRYGSLAERATIFLGLISVISLFGGIKLAAEVPRFGAVATAVFVLLAVLSALASIFIRSYKGICDLEDMVLTIDEEEYESEDVYSELLRNLADAVSHNRRVNDKRATWLQYSALFFALALVTVVITFLTTG